MNLQWHTPGQKARRSTRKHRFVLASRDFNSTLCEPDERFADIRGDECADSPDVPGEQRVLRGRIAPGWSLDTPLIVRVEREDDGSYVVSDDEFAVHGDGETRATALRDYASSLVEYYELLAERASDDEATAALFRRLQDYLKRTDD